MYNGIRGEMIKDTKKQFGAIWIAIINDDGVLDTAFPPDRIMEYLSKERYHFTAEIKKLLK